MADGILTAAVSVTSAVGGIGKLVTYEIGFTSLLNTRIAVAKPSVSSDVVSISIVCTTYLYLFTSHSGQAFLLVLFLAQPLGTSRLSIAFAPSMNLPFFRTLYILSRSWLVTFVWLLLLATTGIYNITRFPGIFRALDPSRAIMCNHRSFWHTTLCLITSFLDFVRTKDYETLSGVLLAVTGCEALFAK